MKPMAVQEVLDFWFGAPDSAEFGSFRADWFAKRPEFDAAVQAGFGEHYAAAATGRLDAWQASADGALALVILLDQFPHHLFRGQARAFATDRQVLATAEAALARGFDEGLLPVQRTFLYLPFEHAEDLAMQDRAVELFTRLAAAHPGFDSQVDYARRHRDVIARFGRFPHRNEALGRVSSAEEIDFLKLPGSRF